MSVHWLPWYAGDHKRDTAHLSTLEDGAYRRLIDHYSTNGPLVDDDRQLATVTGLSLRHWRRIKPTITNLFCKRERCEAFSASTLSAVNQAAAKATASPFWFHKRIERELVKAEKRLAQRQLAGRIGGMRNAVRLLSFDNRVNQFGNDQTKRPLKRAANQPQPQPHKDLRGVGEEDRQGVAEPEREAAPMTASPYLVESINEKVKKWNGS
jgi:uncharacterized protein YdaU (DUF1376 family)